MSRKHNPTSTPVTAVESSGKDLPIAESQVSREKSVLEYFKWIGLLIAFLSAWTPFFGYGYLKGRLEGLGFPKVQLDVPVQEMVFNFFVGVAPKILEIINSFGYFFLWNLAVSAIAVILVMVFALKELDEISGRSRNEHRFFLWFRNLLNQAQYYFLPKLKIGLILFFVAFLFIAVIGVATLAIPVYGWRLGVGGYDAGVDAGEKELTKDFCFQNHNQLCTTLVVNGRPVPVEVLHSDNRYQYVATCEGIYQLDVQNAVRLFKPWANRCLQNKPDAG